jgi:hypothetical protein
MRDRIASPRKIECISVVEAQEGRMTTVWIYLDTKYHPGHPDYLKVFATPVAADE